MSPRLLLLVIALSATCCAEESAPRARPSTSDPTSTPPRGPAIPQAEEIAGLYRLTKRVYNFAIAGDVGSGHTSFRELYYLLSSDGRVFRGVNTPSVADGDIEHFDFTAAQKRSPKDAGTYRLKDNDVILTMGPPPGQIVVAARKRDVLQINDPAFTYGSFPFVRTIRALPLRIAERTAAKPPKTVTLPAASIPAQLEGLPTVVYRAPPGFTDPSGIGRHDGRPHWSAFVEVYDFRPFRGSNVEKELRTTHFRDWLRTESREAEVVGAPAFQTESMEGVDQLLSVAFAEKTDELRTLEGGPEVLRTAPDRSVPRIRSRVALVASGSVALIDVMLRDEEALKQHQAAIAAFTESLKVLPKPPPTTRDEIISIAGNWAWDGKPGFGSDALLHEKQAEKPSYVFSIDGRVIWFEGDPIADFRSKADFDRLQSLVGHTVGTYFKRGDSIVLRFGAAPYYVYFAKILGPDSLEILGYTYHRTLRAAP